MAALLLAIALVLTSVFPVAAVEDIGAPPSDQTPTMRDMRVTDALGDVKIIPADNPKMPAPVDEDTPLQENDIITTGPDSLAEITMDGVSVFRLQPESYFKVMKMYEKNTQLELSEGGLIAKVKPIENEETALIIKMPTAVVAIRGTEFGAETGNGVSHVGVFDEGHVAVGGAWGHEHVKLGPNEETHIPLSNVPVPPQPLYRFKTMRGQMSHVRQRVDYWRTNWQPMPPEQKQRVRDRIKSPQRAPVPGFSHSGMRAEPAAPRKRPARSVRSKHPHHATGRRPVKHRTTASARQRTSSGKSKAPARRKHHPANQ